MERGRNRPRSLFLPRNKSARKSPEIRRKTAVFPPFDRPFRSPPRLTPHGALHGRTGRFLPRPGIVAPPDGSRRTAGLWGETSRAPSGASDRSGTGSVFPFLSHLSSVNHGTVEQPIPVRVCGGYPAERTAERNLGGRSGANCEAKAVPGSVPHFPHPAELSPSQS